MASFCFGKKTKGRCRRLQVLSRVFGAIQQSGNFTLDIDRVVMAPRARIIIVSFNCADYLNRTLESLIAQEEGCFEVVIVDNASKDAQNIVLPVGDRRFELRRQAENLGFARANNIGAQGAATPWLITLNPDAFPRPDWLGRLLAAAEQHPDVDMFGSTQLFDHDPQMIDGEGDCYSAFGMVWRAGHRQRRGPPYFDGPVFSPCACAAMYRRSLFEQVGGFDEDFFCYVEDVDLGFRMRLAGGRAHQVGDAVVHHVSSGISKQYGSFALYHGIRNLLWVIAKDVPMPLALLVAGLFCVLLVYLVGVHWRREEVRPGLRGVADGIKGLGPMLVKRRAVQRGRVVSPWRVARWMVWNPLSAKNRRAVAKPGL